MYTSISELPTQVRNSLDEYSCKRWMQKYNEVLPKDATDSQVLKARREAWEFVKNDPSSFSFNIIATVEQIDRQKELITVDSVAKNMDDYIMRGGVGIDEHADYEVFCAWGWDKMEVQGKPAIGLWGNLYGGAPVYDKTRQDFVNGKNSLSIAGEADLGKYECTEEGCYIKRSVQDNALMEISLCKIPANAGATLIWYNHEAKLTKSVSEGIRLDVIKYTIHKDAQFCPIQAVKKSLLDAGIEAHAKENGVEVSGEYSEVLDRSKTLGYVRKSDGTLLVQSKERMYEKAYGNCLRKGYVNSEGYVLNCMPRKVFKSLCRQRMIDSDGKVFKLVKATEVSESDYRDAIARILDAKRSDLAEWTLDGRTLIVADVMHGKTWKVKYYTEPDQGTLEQMLEHPGEIMALTSEDYE